VTFVCLKARESDSWKLLYSAGKIQCRLSRRNTASPHPDIHFDQQTDDRITLRRNSRDGNCLLDVINSTCNVRLTGQSNESPDLDVAHNLIRDQNVVDSMRHEDFGLAEFRTRHSHCTLFQLPLGQRRAFVILEMGTEFRRPILKEARHLRQISIRRGAIQKKCWRIEFFD
jgi:hypothetical protein